jgi:hypothetical protein
MIILKILDYIILGLGLILAGGSSVIVAGGGFGALVVILLYGMDEGAEAANDIFDSAWEMLKPFLFTLLIGVVLLVIGFFLGTKIGIVA